ncbi:hypothetical protein [Lelliottia amnigena]|uniref:hypothetical protein n=1 Tax=Lelliottia amnigena TaxID=61646 RepID=UPI001C5C8C0C|nr:hypothetical protein [Lelliottia amnigena]QXZ19123.1 hypothetical protein I6L75_18815 [Lelliottia amnigena]
MKLIDILVLELPKRGGWPKGVEEMWQDYDGSIRPGAFGWNHDQIAEDHRRKHEDAHVTINRKQYEAALAASRPEWNGEGLPPVGLVCEGQFPRHPGISFEWQECLVLYVFERECAVKSKGTSTLHYCDDFRPIRSEADKKRDDVTQSILDVLNDYDFEMVHISSDQKRIATDIVERIASGMIPHIRID